MIMSDAKPRQTSILDRGEYLNRPKKSRSRRPNFCRAQSQGAPAIGLASPNG